MGRHLMAYVLMAIFLSVAAYMGPTTKDKAFDVMKDVSHSVFIVSGEKARGTGWVVKAKSGKLYIITNQHVCSDNKTMTLNNNYQVEPVRVVAEDPNSDACILEAPKDAVALSLAKTMIENEEVYGVGYPHVTFLSSASGRAKGYVREDVDMGVDIPNCNKHKYKIKIDASSVPPDMKCVYVVPMLVTTIPTDLGASGSPILNNDEEVVGMTMVMSGSVNWAYGVPLNSIKAFLDNH
jgi:S1-C subfamily serine protease